MKKGLKLKRKEKIGDFGNHKDCTIAIFNNKHDLSCLFEGDFLIAEQGKNYEHNYWLNGQMKAKKIGEKMMMMWHEDGTIMTMFEAKKYVKDNWVFNDQNWSNYGEQTNKYAY